MRWQCLSLSEKCYCKWPLYSRLMLSVELPRMFLLCNLFCCETSKFCRNTPTSSVPSAHQLSSFSWFSLSKPHQQGNSTVDASALVSGGEGRSRSRCLVSAPAICTAAGSCLFVSLLGRVQAGSGISPASHRILTPS